MQINIDEFEKTVRKIEKDDVKKAIFSNRNKTEFKYNKIELENKVDFYQASAFTQKQVFNKKVEKQDFVNYVLETLPYFKQINFFCANCEYEIKVSKKDKLFVFKKAFTSQVKVDTNHNRTKNYLISEGTKIPALVDMGVFTKDYKIVSAMHDKFRQINRYLEIIDNSISNSGVKSLNIVDFGCGKSYLTFIVYYYLKYIKKIDATIIGLDLKEDVIKNCNAAAQKYGYDNLKFFVGDIKDYEPEMNIDMVLTLHACDTATDYALFNAIRWNAKMIFSVPCCQHEINQTFNSKSLSILNRYGIAKERTSAILTDIVRCNLLKSQGYQVDLLEFIDFDATPKNLLIRASTTKIPQKVKQEMVDEVLKLKTEFGFNQTLLELLKNNKMI